jgi:DNA-binding transcriptional regulator GbsR (MarR family)
MDTVGALVEHLGLKRPLGLVWSLLYLSPEPLPASEIGARLRMSASAVSRVLAELARWGAVKKAWRRGERRDLYEAEAAVDKVVARLLRERELGLLRESIERFGAAERQSGAFERERIARLRAFAQAGAARLDAILGGGILAGISRARSASARSARLADQPQPSTETTSWR